MFYLRIGLHKKQRPAPFLLTVASVHGWFHKICSYAPVLLQPGLPGKHHSFFPWVRHIVSAPTYGTALYYFLILRKASTKG